MNTTGPPVFADPGERIDLPILDQRFKANPYPFYEGLRGQGRTVVPIRLPTGVEAWLVTDYDEARRLLNDARLSKHAVNFEGRPEDAGAALHPLFHHLLTQDPPEHTRLRAIVAREFSARRVNLLRPRILEFANQLLDGIAPRGAADLVAEFALPLPLRVICELVGIPATDVGRVRDCSARLAAADLDDTERVPDIAQEMQDYLLHLAREKRAEPDDSLYSTLVAASDRDELSENELASMAFLLLMAGHETTTSLIGNGVLALQREPSAWAALCADEHLAQSAVEEILRFESPLEAATARYATTEIQIGDALIRAGDRVFVGLAAANRDPRHFACANHLDIRRDPPADHLAFGHGIHYCLGAGLARAQGEIALAALARHFPDLALAVPLENLEWTPGLIMRGLRRLPVRFQPR